MRTNLTSIIAGSSRVTHYRNGVSGIPSSTTYQDTEQHLFAFPALLTGSKTLKIAETRYNKQISSEVSAARVTADGPLLIGAAVA